MTVYWTYPAEEDAAGIVMRRADYSGRDSARVLADELQDAAESLAKLSSRGRPGLLAGTRELLVGGYILVYAVIGSDAHILRCLDARRLR